MIGDRVRVWWTDEENCHKGTLSAKTKDGRMYAKYDDGNEGWVHRENNQLEAMTVKRRTRGKGENDRNNEPTAQTKPKRQRSSRESVSKDRQKGPKKLEALLADNKVWEMLTQRIGRHSVEILERGKE